MIREHWMTGVVVAFGFANLVILIAVVWNG